MCTLPTDPWKPADYRAANPDELAAIHRWLADGALAVATCTGCGSLTFVCSAQCGEAFRQEHLPCISGASATHELDDQQDVATGTGGSFAPHAGGPDGTVIG